MSVYNRIKETTTGLYVGFGDKNVTLAFDLYHVDAGSDTIYTAGSYKEAETMCTLLNKISSKVYPCNKWNFIVESTTYWYPENNPDLYRPAKLTLVEHAPVRI